MKIILLNFVNTLRRYKTSSIINIAGLALAFAAFYVIMVQINYELGFNKGLKDADRIYRIEVVSGQHNEKFHYSLNRPLGEDLIRCSHLIESGGTGDIFSRSGSIFINHDNNIQEHTLRSGYVSLSLLNVFNFDIVEGNIDELGKPQTFALSQSASKRLQLKVGDSFFFGKSDPQQEYTVIAIFADFPLNSDLGKIEGIYDIGETDINVPNHHFFPYFVKLRPNSNVEELAPLAQKAYADALLRQGYPKESTDEVLNERYFRFLPITETYFTNNIDYARNEIGNKSTTYCLLAIAIFVIAIALINFINFFFALVPIRIKSVNTYKVFGSPTIALRASFIFESVGMVIISLLFAVLIVNIVSKSAFSSFISMPLNFSYNTPILLLTIGLALLTAIIGSLYPAYYITSFPTAMVLKGSFASSKSGQRLRYVLIGFQFVVSISLIIATSFIKIQHNYLKNHDLGFNNKHLLGVNIPPEISRNAASREAFSSYLQKNSQIVDMAWAASPMVAETRATVMREVRGEIKTFEVYSVSWNFLKFMGIDIVEGRDFTQSDELVADHGMLIFNHKSKEDLDIVLEDRVQWVNTNSYTEIIGFCKNFNSKPLHYGYSPIAFMVYGTDEQIWRLNRIYLRTADGANIAETINLIQTSIVKFAPTVNPDNITITSFNDETSKHYEKERKLTMLITAFTVLSVIISLMGVFGLVMFETQFRRKEIGLRRVHGATVNEILILINNKFVRIVLICFLIATPIAYFFIDRWLNTFTYRTPMHWWIFVLSFLLIFVITAATVTLRSLKAATSNPAESIKAE